MNSYFFKKFFKVDLFLLVFIISFIPQHSWSQDYKITNFRGKKATTEDFVKALKPSPDQAIQDGELEFRGLVIGSAKNVASMELKFEFDSYKLTESAKGYLDQLGPALKHQDLASYKFLVEGHTDSRGMDEYNMSLSKKRALAVKQYLIYNFGIDSNRLDAVGRGESNLLDRENPKNALNRRVQIVNLQ